MAGNCYFCAGRSAINMAYAKPLLIEQFQVPILVRKSLDDIRLFHQQEQEIFVPGFIDIRLKPVWIHD